MGHTSMEPNATIQSSYLVLTDVLKINIPAQQ